VRTAPSSPTQNAYTVYQYRIKPEKPQTQHNTTHVRSIRLDLTGLNRYIALKMKQRATPLRPSVIFHLPFSAEMIFFQI